MFLNETPSIMKSTRLFSSALLSLLCIGVWAQTNILGGWDGGSATGLPTTFGWSANYDAAWQALNATSGERFVTNYANYVAETGVAYTYDAADEVSRKLLYLHFSAGSSYTYSYAFEGLQPGHAYRFTGLVAWHNNDETNKGTCSVSIESADADVAYMQAFTDINTKKRLYPMHATFMVPEGDASTHFRMVVSNGKSGAMMSLSGIGLYDLGEVETLAWNGDVTLHFSEDDAVGAGVYNYIRDRKGDLTLNAQAGDVAGWYCDVKAGDTRAGAVVKYGSGIWVGGSGDDYKAPVKGPDELSNGCALGLVAVWGSSIGYIKPASFPAGRYTLTIPVCNTASDNSLAANRIGFVEDNGITHYASTRSYVKGQWTTERVELTFEHDVRGYLSLGYLSQSNGNANVEHLFIDRIDISGYTFAEHLDRFRQYASDEIDDYVSKAADASADFETAIAAARTTIAAADDVATIGRCLVDVRNAYVANKYQVSDWQDVDLGEVNLENDQVQRFLAAADYSLPGASSVITSYATGIFDWPRPVEICIPERYGAHAGMTLTVSDAEDYDGAAEHTQTLNVASSLTIYQLYNTAPGITYYYKVEADGEVLTKGKFVTTGRVRMIATRTGSNIRDLGGRTTIDGRHVRYGRLFRGGELHAGFQTTMSSADLAELARLGIEAELDLRGSSDINGSVPSRSAIAGADYKFLDLGVSSVKLCTEAANRTKVRDGIQFVANALRAGKHVYFHCIWGADRTGAFGLFLGAILGFSLDDLYKDFELTSFSKAGIRPMNGDAKPLTDKVDYCQQNYEGDTVQDRIVAFLKDCGVTDDDIQVIRDYMLEGSPLIPDTIGEIEQQDNRQNMRQQPVYDLMGRRWQGRMRRGLYIAGGRKVVVF